MGGAFLTLVGTAAGSGPAVTIRVFPSSVAAFNTLGSTASARINFNNNGSVTESINGAPATTLYNWCVPSAEAVNYEIYATPVSGSVSAGSSAVNTWLALSTNRSWLVSTTSGTRTAILNIGIRRVGSTDVLGSADVELYAEST